ncbi:uncharacterized protein N7482_006790 [Penicillium canariense]|uniref:DUF7702 domain-containing protein n=1 Tax=Penicillium canariense TaxID=189055 RepID=A0A9W9HY85_9EURO|nr:uncharacterized protein N7482_006790 [Penicillium canariense]KAJ5159786.1 hypothetical protein N7482_006790 [Penicillium canariense]
MATVTYRDGIAILQLIFFPVLLVAALFIWKRTGWKAARKSWRFVVTLSLIRIAGGICTLLAISNDSSNILIAEAVCELIGIAPLLLTYIGLLRQIDTKQRVHPKFISAVAITCFIGLILGIAGISIDDDNTSTYHANSMVKAAMGIFLAVFAIVTLLTAWLAVQLRPTLGAGQKKLFLAILLSWPFLLVRVVYSAIADFTDDPRFAILTGDATIYLCMDVLEEIIAMVICVVFGVLAVLNKEGKQPLDEEKSGPGSGEI